LVAKRRRASAAEEKKASSTEVAVMPPFQQELAEAVLPLALNTRETRLCPRTASIQQENTVVLQISFTPPRPERDRGNSSRSPID
jgi:hypothetical protein